MKIRHIALAGMLSLATHTGVAENAGTWGLGVPGLAFNLLNLNRLHLGLRPYRLFLINIFVLAHDAKELEVPK